MTQIALIRKIAKMPLKQLKMLTRFFTLDELWYLIALARTFDEGGETL